MALAVDADELGQLRCVGCPLRLVLAAAAQGVDPVRRGSRLGHTTRMALADADCPPPDDHFYPEDLVVVRALGVEEAVLRPLSREPLGVLLESALRALQGTERPIARQLGRGQGSHELVDGTVPEVQVDGTDESLEGGREQGRPAAAAALRFALAEQQILAELQPIGQTGQTGGAHDRCPPSGENALVVVRVATIEGVRDGQAHHGVAQELQALVVAGGQVPMLVQIAAVDQRLL